MPSASMIMSGFCHASRSGPSSSPELGGGEAPRMAAILGATDAAGGDDQPGERGSRGDEAEPVHAPIVAL